MFQLRMVGVNVPYMTCTKPRYSVFKLYVLKWTTQGKLYIGSVVVRAYYTMLWRPIVEYVPQGFHSLAAKHEHFVAHLITTINSVGYTNLSFGNTPL